MATTWDDASTDDLYHVRKPAVTYLLNDLRYALTNTKTDVDFEVFRSVQKRSSPSNGNSTKIAAGDDDDSHDVRVVIPLHSSVLLARLPWFRVNFDNLRDNTLAPDDADCQDGVIEEAKYDEANKKFTILLKRADKENDTGVDPNTVYEFVKFLYSAQCKVSSETVNGLLRLAQKFLFDSLLEKIEQFYIEGLKNKEYDLKKQIELLKTSDHHKLEEVKNVVMRLIKENENAPTSPAWKKLLKDNPKLLSELYSLD